MIRTIIIDNEPLAIEALEIILKKNCMGDLDVIASSTSPQMGRSLIEEHQPDLVFLDVEMPGLNGIDLLKSFSNPGFQVVIVTAFDAYAIEALRLSAIDYLLKPVEKEEIIRVVNKIKAGIGKNETLLGNKILYLEKLLTRNNTFSGSRIGVAMADKIIFLETTEILYCEAQGVYTNIHMSDGKKILASKTLGDFESMLSTQQFFRIHHSTLINLNGIKEFKRSDGGYVLMQNNEKLHVSHRKRKDFLAAIDDMVI